MFVAVDVETETAVSAREMAENDRDPESSGQNGASFRCLACGETLAYCGEAADTQAGPFVHQRNESDCARYANTSKPHRLGQEGVAKELFNWLSLEIEQIDIEHRVGTASNFLIADVAVGPPFNIVVEVVCLGTVDLKRRLQTMGGVGYAGLVVVVSSSPWSASQIDHHFRRLGIGQVGQFNPDTFDVQFGSVLRPEKVNFDSPGWDQAPEYLI